MSRTGLGTGDKAGAGLKQGSHVFHDLEVDPRNKEEDLVVSITSSPGWQMHV